MNREVDTIFKDSSKAAISRNLAKTEPSPDRNKSATLVSLIGFIFRTALIIAIMLVQLVLAIRVVNSLPAWFSNDLIIGIYIQGLVLDTEASAAPSNIAYGGALVFVLLLLIATISLARDAILFPFALFHLILFLTCLSLDLFYPIFLVDFSAVASGFFTFMFYVMLFSLAIFSMFLRSFTKVLLYGGLCSFVSISAFSIALIVLSLASIGFSGSSIMFLLYITMAYGVFGIHIWSLSLLLNQASMR